MKCVSVSTSLQNLHVLLSRGSFGLAYLPLSILSVCALTRSLVIIEVQDCFKFNFKWFGMYNCIVGPFTVRFRHVYVFLNKVSRLTETDRKGPKRTEIDAFYRTHVSSVSCHRKMSANNGVSGKADSVFTYEQFLALHKSQLENSCVPELYWQTLCIKLKNEVHVMGFRDQI